MAVADQQLQRRHLNQDSLKIFPATHDAQYGVGKKTTPWPTI